MKRSTTHLDKIMFLQGLVTKLDEEILAFVVNNVTTVHMAFLYLHDPRQSVPNHGAPIKISAVDFRSDSDNITSVVLLPGDQVECEFMREVVIIDEPPFLDFIRQRFISPQNLHQFGKNYNVVSEQFNSPDWSSRQLMQSLIDELGKTEFELETLHNVHYIDNEQDAYNKLTQWTFGNHRQRVENRYLLGYIFIDKPSVRLIFTNYTKRVFIMIMLASKENLERFIRSYVIIKCYVVMTELYNDQQFRAMEYLVVDAKDIQIIPVFSQPRSDFLSNTIPPSDCYDSIVNLKIISKSSPIQIGKGQLQYWLEVITDTNHHFLLCLTFVYAEIFILLQEDTTYTVYYKSPMDQVSNSEIRKTCPSLRQFQLPKRAIFVSPTTDIKNKGGNTVVDISEAVRLITTCSTRLTFQGTISTKRFVNPIGSRTVKASPENVNYGTPGSKTHVLDFCSGNSSMTLFLNNWENMQLPLGVVPNMKVIVRNVVAQKGKYYKSTAMTSIEPVEYTPPIQFESATLFSWGCKNWGTPFFLGFHKEIPINVVIWAAVPRVLILSLTIARDGSQLKVTIWAITRDAIGEAKVVAKDEAGKLLLKLLLGTPDPVFQNWWKRMELVESFKYVKGKACMLQGIEEKDYIRLLLTRHFELINKRVVSLHLKGRKMQDEHNGPSVYFLLDARRPLLIS